MIAAYPPPPFWIWPVLLVVGGLLMWWGAVQGRRAAANLRALAQRLGFEYLEDQRVLWITTAIVTGQRDGREVRFFTFITRTGKSSTTWRAVSVRPRAIGGLLFNVQPQGLVTKLNEFFVTEEITVGDAAFDAAWFLETNEPEFLRAALVPEVRTKLMAVHATIRSGGNFQLQEAAVRYVEAGTFVDAETCLRLERMLPVLDDLADIAEVSAERRS